MNIFEKVIKDGKISSDLELKRLFWKLAKKLHPDVNCFESNSEKFIRLKSDYETVLGNIRNTELNKKNSSSYNRKFCIDIFTDLLASNFPIDKSIKKPKIYKSRLEKLNNELSKLGNIYKDLFIKFEDEMYKLRGSSVVLNHDYSLVKLYLYQFSDYTYSNSRMANNYLINGYDQLVNILEDKKLNVAKVFIDWLVSDIVKRK